MLLKKTNTGRLFFARNNYFTLIKNNFRVKITKFEFKVTVRCVLWGKAPLNMCNGFLFSKAIFLTIRNYTVVVIMN